MKTRVASTLQTPPPLPSEVLYVIISFAVEAENDNRRQQKEIYSYCLVSKAWYGAAVSRSVFNSRREVSS